MKKKIWILTILVTVLCIGGCSMSTKNGQPSKEEMLEIVKSEEVIKQVENSLKRLDKNALTSEGIIKTYTVDYDSIRWNPMGSIRYKLYINNKKELNISIAIHKYNGKLETGVSSYSSELDDLLEGRK